MLISQLKLVLWTLLAVQCPLVFSQTSSTPNLQVGHESWTFKEGAPERVYALAQTTDGFLWLGTPTGLFRFDGTRFERFSSPFGDQLLSTSIASLYASESGGLWIGYQSGGVSFLNNGRVKTYADASADARVLGFAQDSKGALWLATSRGLWTLDHSRWQHVGADWNAPAGSVHPMAFDRDDTLWAISGTKLLYLLPGSNQFHTAEQNLLAPEFTVDADGKVVTRVVKTAVISTTGGNPGESRSVYPVFRNESGQIVDRTHSLWVSSAEPVIFRLAPTEQSYHTANKLSGSKFETYDINPYWDAKLVDREGNVWFGDAHGIHRLFYSPLIKQQLPKDVVDNFVIASDDHGAVWIGSLDSPLYHVSRVDTTLRLRNPMASLYRAPDHSFWFGGSPFAKSPGGLFHLVGHHLSRVDLPRELDPKTTSVRAISADRLGRLWVSFSPGGLYRLEKGIWTPFGGRADFPKTPFLSECTDTLGRLWFGGFKNQLATLDGERLQVFGSRDGVHVGNIAAIYGRGSEIWIGGEFGLQQFDGVRFHDINAVDKEWFRGISGIVETAGGDLWLNGLSGIFHIRRTDVVEALKNPSYQVRGERYSRRAGVPGLPAQIFTLPTAVEGTDGRLWFALSAGVVWLDPTHFENKVLSPLVTIQLVSADDKNYPEPSGLKFPARTSSVQITYAAVSLSDPEAIHLRYKLEETDKDWHEVGAASPVSYRNLAPGSYHFVVNATDTNGVWSDAVATAEFTILPAFFQTRWFIALCAVSAVAILYLLYMLRVRQVTRQFEVRLEERIGERTRIARELHDTLLQTFQGLLLKLHAITRVMPDRPAEAQKRLETVIDQAQQAVTEGRDAVQGLRSSTVVTNDLSRAIHALGAELVAAQSDSNTPDFRVDVEGTPRNIVPIVRDDVYRVAGEAVRNAFQHAQAKRIEVVIHYDQRQLRLHIRDDGKGIDTNVLESGARAGHYGLPGLQERAKLVGGKLTVRSEAGFGTEVELTIPASIVYTSSASGRHAINRRKTAS